MAEHRDRLAPRSATTDPSPQSRAESGDPARECPSVTGGLARLRTRALELGREPPETVSRDMSRSQQTWTYETPLTSSKLGFARANSGPRGRLVEGVPGSSPGVRSGFLKVRRPPRHFRTHPSLGDGLLGGLAFTVLEVSRVRFGLVV